MFLADQIIMTMFLQLIVVSVMQKRSLSFEIRGLQTVMCVGYSKEAKERAIVEQRAKSQRAKSQIKPKTNNTIATIKAISYQTTFGLFGFVYVDVL